MSPQLNRFSNQLNRRLKTFMVLLGLSLSWLNGVAQVNPADSLALIDLFSSTAGGDWLISWDTTQNVTEWFGVDLDENNVRVRGLALSNNQVAGFIPTSIGDLSKLTTLDLSNNAISGEIPPEIGSLDTLILLNLSSNQISDTIPDEIGNLNNLKTLDFSENQISGPIPLSFSGLDSIRTISLSDNSINGSIPTELSQLDSLTTLNLANNELEGDFPNFIVSYDRLQSFNLSNNFVTGELPTNWSNLNDLRILDLSNNQISGSLPAGLGALTFLEELDLTANQLSGEIPIQIGDLDSLKELQLASNELSSLPTTIGNLENLELLILSENDFNQEIPVQLGSLSSLKTLMLNDNSFFGIIPNEIGSLLSLEVLNLSSNKLDGAIPENFEDLINLRTLNVSENLIEDLSDLNNLQSMGALQNIDVSSNGLTFEDLELNIDLFSNPAEYSPQFNVDDTLRVSVSIGNSVTLSTFVDSAANIYRWKRLDPDSIVNPSFLPENRDLIIDPFVDENSGTYTCEIMNTSVPGLTLLRNPVTLFTAIDVIDSLTLLALNEGTNGDEWLEQWDKSSPVFAWEGVDIEGGKVTGLSLSNNNLNGPLTDSLGFLDGLTSLNLSNNEIIGGIPSGFSNLENLTIIDLSNNDLSGRIPDFGNKPDLLLVDLSRNRLDSTLTSQFDSLGSVTLIDVSDNSLSGGIPSVLSNLLTLQVLNLSENNFDGGLISELSKLENLETMDLSENLLSDTIPGSYFEMPTLQELNLARNNISGEVPAQLMNNNNLNELLLNDNQLTGFPTLSSQQYSNLELRIFGNNLTFEDFVDNYNGFNSVGREDDFLFLPQTTLTNVGSFTVPVDSSITLTIPDNHSDSKFRWRREGAILAETSNTLLLDSAGIGASGTYFGEVWTINSNFTNDFNTPTDSVLITFSYTILVPPPIPQVHDPKPFCIGNNRVSLTNTVTNQQSLLTRWYAEYPTTGTAPIFEGNPFNYEISAAVDTLFVTTGLIVNKDFQSPPDTVIVISQPWIKQSLDSLIAQPSQSDLDIRFPQSEFTLNYEWFEDGLLSGETLPFISPPDAGVSYQVRVLRAGCSSTSDSVLPTLNNLVTSIQGNHFDNFSIEPNPAVNRLNLNISSNLKDFSYQILDVRGVRVLQGNVTKNLDISRLKRGVYFLMLFSSKTSYSARFVKVD